MPKICITLIIGIPGAGKTTFVKNLPKVLPMYGNFEFYSVIYDNLLESDYHINYKLNRQVPFAATKKLIEEIHHRTGVDKEYIIAVDDNMYFKSMRYEYYKLARKYQTSFFQVYFDVPVPIALQRNANRESTVPEHIISNMAHKFERPSENWEKHFITVNSDDLDNLLFKFFAKLRECLNDPVVNIIRTYEKAPINKLQKYDLVLRKIVHKKVKQDTSRASHLCSRRIEIFKSIKESKISVDSSLDDGKLEILLESLF